MRHFVGEPFRHPNLNLTLVGQLLRQVPFSVPNHSQVLLNLGLTALSEAYSQEHLAEFVVQLPSCTHLDYLNFQDAFMLEHLPPSCHDHPAVFGRRVYLLPISLRTSVRSY